MVLMVLMMLMVLMVHVVEARWLLKASRSGR